MDLATYGQNLQKPSSAVTADEISMVLSRLKSLPSRTSDTAEIDLLSFEDALEGVSATVLLEAVRQVNQAVLGHAFHPSPPELRMLCDKIQRQISEDRARKAEGERQRRESEQRRLQHEKTKTPEARARVAAMLARFNQDHEARQAAARSDGLAETAEQVRDRLKGQIGETAFNNIPDLPVRDTFKQVGHAR